jgi:hypothetical protein
MYLTDTDIMDWNSKIPEKLNLFISARYSNTASWPTIIVTSKSKLGIHEPKEIGDFDLSFIYTYSISSNRIEEFEDIFQKISKESFENYVLNASGSFSRIKFDKSIVQIEEKSTHKVYNKEYIRIKLHLSGKLSSIMAYVGCLEAAMEYFSMIWGYDEDGKEYCLLKYPIGSIVSTKDDKTKELLVIEYKFSRNGCYNIDYIVCEMLSQKNSPIVKYGNTQTISENKLCWNRDNRINGILDDE